MKNLTKNTVPASVMPLLENLKPSEKFKEIKIRIKADKVIVIWFQNKKVVNTSGNTIEEAIGKMLNKTKIALA